MKPQVVCPYCGSFLDVKPLSFIYGSKFADQKYKDKSLLVCSNYPKCDSYGSRTVASPDLRFLRRKCHELFDPLYYRLGMSRTEAYKALSNALQIPEEDCHIALFGIEECKTLLSFLERLISKGKTLRSYLLPFQHAKVKSKSMTQPQLYQKRNRLK